MVHIKIGAPVEGADFFDRERELLRLWHHLEGDHVLLLAPRRIGKTSLMLRLRDQASEKGFHPSYVTVEAVQNEIGFVEKLYKAALSSEPAKHRIARLRDGPLGRFFKRVKKAGPIELGDDASAHWTQLGEALGRTLGESGERLLFLVDEVPVFILQLLQQDPSGARARSFLHWFRELRNDPARGSNVRWLVAGSIGLDTVARRLRLSKTINDFYVFNELGAFSGEVANSFLDQLAATYLLPLSAEVKERIFERVGWLIPYHLQLLFSALRDCSGDNQATPTVGMVDMVYEKVLSKRPNFDHWEERLHEEMGSPDDRQAIDLLNAIAVDKGGTPLSTLQAVLSRHIADQERRQEQLTYLLDVLAGDGYVVAERDRYRFLSPLLRDYWARRIGPRTGSE